MGKTKSNQKQLNVAVYWGGAELGRYCRSLSKSKGVVAGKGFFCDIKSIIWPRWDELEIIIPTKSGLILNPNLPWDGIFYNGKKKVVLNSTKMSKILLEIDANTSASLRLDEMSVAIRVGQPFTPQEDRILPQAGYIASPLEYIFTNSTELSALGVAALAASIIFLSSFVTLKNRKNDHYGSFAQLKSEQLLPFISQSYFANAPNILQSNLDRFNFVKSTWNFYTDMANVIGFGKEPTFKNTLFDSTVNAYAQQVAQQKLTLQAAEQKQRSKISENHPQKGSLSLPMVLGESIEGRTLRVLDKISTIANINHDLVSRRNRVAEEFSKDIGYKFENNKDEEATSEAFAKLSQGFMGVSSDLELQAGQSKDFAARAAIIQMDLFGKERLKFGPINCCIPPAGAPLTQDGLTWISPILTQAEEVSIASLKASTWGAPVHEAPKIHEPLAGHIDPILVEKIVAAGKFQLRLCYELSLRRNQASTGSMEWKWLIDSRGLIANIDLLKSSIKDDELIKCVRDKIATWKFPKPKGGSVEVRYPFEFAKDKG